MPLHTIQPVKPTNTSIDPISSFTTTSIQYNNSTRLHHHPLPAIHPFPCQYPSPNRYHDSHHGATTLTLLNRSKYKLLIFGISSLVALFSAGIGSHTLSLSSSDMSVALNNQFPSSVTTNSIRAARNVDLSTKILCE